MKRIVSAIIFLLSYWSISSIAAIRNVPSGYSTIQDAIDAAVDGDTVVVADGTYRGEGNRDIDFGGKGITLKSEDGPENCIIDCGGTAAEPHRGFYFHNGEDANSVLSGLTITGGYATEASYPDDFEKQLSIGNQPYGGAIYCDQASPTIINCKIIRNTACAPHGDNWYLFRGYGNGGGIYCQGAKGPTVSNCVISGNQALAPIDAIIKTGNPLDMVIDGNGYFVLSDGAREIFTRRGSFGIGWKCMLVDPMTGYYVQRIGSTGEDNGFQMPGDPNIHIPYDDVDPFLYSVYVDNAGTLVGRFLDYTEREIARISLVLFDEPNALESIKPGYFIPAVNSGSPFATLPGENGAGGIRSGYLENWDDDETASELKIVSTGRPYDMAIEGDGFFVLNDGTGDIFTRIGSFDIDANGILVEPARGLKVQRIGSVGEAEGFQIPGEQNIRISDDMSIPPKPTSTIALRGNLSADMGGERDFVITIYDSQGGYHLLSARFIQTEISNTWDLVVTSVAGEITPLAERRIEGITFNNTGCYSGLASGDPSFEVKFPFDPAATQTISFFFGTPSSFDGLTQFAGNSTAATTRQDGYEAGTLSSVSVNNDGTLVGVFSNGIKSNIAQIKLATFPAPWALEAIDHGYFIANSASGAAVFSQAMSGSVGQIVSEALLVPTVNVPRKNNSFGGGIYSLAPITVKNCVIANNSSDNGAGVYCQSDTMFGNCTIADNRAVKSGGGVYCSIITGPKEPFKLPLPLPNPEDTVITNSILSGNTAEQGPQLTLESIGIWLTPTEVGKPKGQFAPVFPCLRVAYSNIQGSVQGVQIEYDDCLAWEQGTIDEYPRFANVTNGDYHLQANSPCINAGEPDFVCKPNETDIDGQVRVLYGRVDIGADEFEFPPLECTLKIKPQAINRKSNQRQIEAHIKLPDGIASNDIDTGEPIILYCGTIEAGRQWISPAGKAKQKLFDFSIFFDKDAVMAGVATDGEIELKVVGKLKTGQYFCGVDTLKIIH